MGELILHIGTTKTGSTALQQFFLENREKLAEHGIDYPEFTKQPARSKRNGIFVRRYCSAKARMIPPALLANDVGENLRRLATSLSAQQRTLISDEDFSLAPSWLTRPKQPNECYWNVVARVLGEAHADRVTIVVYLRRQDDWIASYWRQAVKTGWRKIDLDTYCNSRETHICTDYAAMLASIDMVMQGRANIVVRRYEQGAFEGGDIYHDFCFACGIPWDERYELPKKDNNPSISFDIAEALGFFAKVAPYGSPLRQDVLKPLARELSHNNPDPPRMTPFDEKETWQIMEPYLEGNEQIAKKYLNGQPLFSEEYGERPIWVPNEDRIAEYRAVFKDAIEQYYRQHGYPKRFDALLLSMPEEVQRPIKFAKNNLVRSWTYVRKKVMRMGHSR